MEKLMEKSPSQSGQIYQWLIAETLPVFKGRAYMKDDLLFVALRQISVGFGNGK
jgi:hypothetical protein